MTLSVRDTPPNSHQPGSEIGAVVMVVAMSASRATAPPCISPIGLQKADETSSANVHSAKVLDVEGKLAAEAEMTLMERIRRASNPWEVVIKYCFLSCDGRMGIGPWLTL